MVTVSSLVLFTSDQAAAGADTGLGTTAPGLGSGGSSCQREHCPA